MKKIQRILAVCGIVILLSLYIACLALAIAGKHQATTLFRAALGATIAVPLVLYGFIMLVKVFPPFVKNDETGGESPADETDAAALPEEGSASEEDVSE